jgi:hypothetical protein
VLAVALTACNSELAPQYRVTDLRILAVQVLNLSRPWADADLGDQLQLSALVANPLDRAPLTVRWFTCLPDGTEALPACLDPSVLRDLDRLASVPGVIELPQSGPRITVTIPDIEGAFDTLLAKATSEPARQCQLYVELPIVALAEAGERREIAVKRIRLTPADRVVGTPLEGGYVPNENPVLLSVHQIADEDAPCGEGALVVAPCLLCPSLACGGDGFCPGGYPATDALLCGRSDPRVPPQEFNQCSPDGERTAFYEDFEWQWYATGGTFPEYEGIGNAVGKEVEFFRPPGPFTLWVVLRDGRGGETWLERSFPAR